VYEHILEEESMRKRISEASISEAVLPSVQLINTLELDVGLVDVRVAVWSLLLCALLTPNSVKRKIESKYRVEIVNRKEKLGGVCGCFELFIGYMGDEISLNVVSISFLFLFLALVLKCPKNKRNIVTI
jgi:hypothetical protein